MPRRKHPPKFWGAAGSIWSGALAQPGRGVARAISDSSGIVPMAQSSREAASAGTGEMLQKMASSSGWEPMVHPEQGAACTGLIEEMLHNKDALSSSRGALMVHTGEGAVGTVSSGGVQMVHPGKLAAGSGSGSTEDMLQKKAAMASSRGAPMTYPAKGVTGSGSSGAMLREKAAAASSRGALLANPGKRVTGSGSSGTRLQKKAAAASSGGVPRTHSGKVAAGSGSSGTILQKKANAASPGGAPTTHPSMGATGSRSSQGMPRKKAAAASSGGASTTLPWSGEYPALCALDRNTTAQDCEESAAKHSTKKGHKLTSAKIQQKNCTEDKAADMGLSGRTLQKQSSRMEVDTGLSEEMLHEHPAKESDTAKDIQDSNSNKIVHSKDETIQGAELLIQKLNDLGKGEDISNEEFLGYCDRLSSDPGWIDLRASLEEEELNEQENRHALYRLRYYKYQFKQQASKEELHGDKLKEDHNLSILHKFEDDSNEEFLEEDSNADFLEEYLYYDKLKEDRHLSLLQKSEDDCNEEFLEEEGFFRRFEEAKTFDWFFHPNYLDCPSVNDYQCLVLKNYGGTEYTRWSEYHENLHTYEIELEYVKYCEELTKQLKWMEDYIDTSQPSVQWRKISSRGAYQAIKIAATSFDKITLALAYNGYFECKESLVYDYTWFKELDGVYFEIWWRITHETKSFKEALEEVYNLNRFLSRQHEMKAALEVDDIMKMTEEEFHTCTAAITPEVEDKAQELIAEAVKKRVNEPKSYEQYIRKKMQIARIIGILDSEELR